MRNFKLIFVLLCISVTALLLPSCGNSKINSDENYSFSLTITPNIDPGGTYLISKSCTLTNNGLTTNAAIKHNSQYSLTYFNQDNKKVYYTSNVDKNREGGDQLFSFDIKNKKYKQLTNELYAINYIIPVDEDNIFVAAVNKGSRVVSPSYYNFAENKLIDLRWDDDFYISVSQRDPESGKIFVAGYSGAEDYAVLDQLNSEKIKGPVGINNKVFQLFQNQHKLVFELKKRYIESFAVNGEYLICKTFLQNNDGNMDSKIITYNLNTKKQKELTDISISGDIFYFDNISKNVYSNTGAEIIKTNISTNEKEVLFSVDINKGWINNAQ